MTRLTLAVGALLVALHAAFFSQFFPAGPGWGHDHALFLPRLLDGNFWLAVNGFLSLPWFTPSFCGGLPKFPDPQALYLSIPQLLSFATDPATAIRISFVLFAAVGFFGMERLLLRSFGVGTALSILGATLFLYNDFFPARLLIGHLTYHSYMLAPLLFHVLLRHAGESEICWRHFRSDTLMGSGIIAYLAYTSLPHTLLQVLAASLGVAALLALQSDHFRWQAFALRFAASSAGALALYAGKAVAVGHYLSNFPRSLYPLPGVESPIDLIHLVLRALFWRPPVELANQVLTNTRVPFELHEWEFGVTPLPALILAAVGLVALARRLRSGKGKGLGSSPNATQRTAAIGLLVLMLIPLALNFYWPGWNALLKQIPMIGSSSILFRWLSVYLVLAIVASIVALRGAALAKRYDRELAILGIAFSVFWSFSADRSHYASQSYDPTPLEAAAKRVRTGVWQPRIDRIGVVRDQAGRETMPFDNSSLASGASQLYCYEPLFGYELELFPQGALHEGPIVSAGVRSINLKEPSCYVYPEANDCLPGDHFDPASASEALRFAAFQPLDFEQPPIQTWANRLSLGALALWLVTAGLAVAGSSKAQHRGVPAAAK